MFRVFISIFTYILVLNFGYSQNQGNIWVFSDSAALDFNTGTPVPLFGTGVVSRNANTSISDTGGNLLFYSGAYTEINNGAWEAGVFNQYNQLIQNGTGIYCNSSLTQSILLLPFVNDTNKYYLFTNRSNASIPDNKIYYSVIDKMANSDSGAVFLKNMLLPGINDMSGHMQAVRHGNGIDWWLITHKGNGNQYYIYLIDSSGISAPIIQATGSNFPLYNAGGQMKITPDGTKLVLVNTFGHIDLFDFDRCTGILSNWISLGYNNTNIFYLAYFATSFSPNSQILYVSGEDTLVQFDLQATNIATSKQIVWYDSDTLSDIGDHLLGPDGKIYIAYAKPTIWYINAYTFENMHLSVINSPDSLGLACDFQPFSFYLGSRRTYYGLPNIPDYKLGALEPPCVVSVGEVEGKNQINVFPNPANDLISVSVNKLNSDFYLELTDIFGRILLKTKFRNQTEINVSHLPTGVYCIIIEDHKTGERFMQKIVKK
jgi:hypothetical protein